MQMLLLTYCVGISARSFEMARGVISSISEPSLTIVYSIHSFSMGLFLILGVSAMTNLSLGLCTYSRL